MGEWLPIQSAPRDGRRVLLLFKHESELPERVRGFSAIPFVGKWVSREVEWSFAAPVGHGGICGAWLDGWHPLPPSIAATQEGEG